MTKLLTRLNYKNPFKQNEIYSQAVVAINIHFAEALFHLKLYNIPQPTPCVLQRKICNETQTGPMQMHFYFESDGNRGCIFYVSTKLKRGVPEKPQV